jgi:hypothetical protein
MILYHTTAVEHLSAIIREGLLPSEFAIELPHGWPAITGKAVCLSENPLFYFTKTEWTARCRIEVVIPSTDRRLMKYGKRLRKNCPPECIEPLTACLNEVAAEYASQQWHRDWIYFGVIAPDRIRAVKADGKDAGDAVVAALAEL